MKAAAYESTIFADLSEQELLDLIHIATKDVIHDAPNLRVEHESSSQTTLRCGINLWSWGERIILTPEQRSIRIVSQCRFPLQFIDWGKNRKNVEIIRAAVQRRIKNEVTRTTSA